MPTQPFAPISWVYSLKDYQSIFKLTNDVLGRRVLEFPAAVSSFNSQMKALGHEAVSASPFYAMEQAAMEELVAEWMKQLTMQQVACLTEGGQLPSDASNMVRRWKRMSDIFLTDYSCGIKDGRYAFSGDTHLAFADDSFDLALCVGVDMTDGDLPILIAELTRVAHEFRLVLSFEKETGIPEWLQQSMLQLQSQHRRVSFKPTQMLYGDQPWVLMQASAVACLVS